MSDNEKAQKLDRQLELIKQQGIDPKREFWSAIESRVNRSKRYQRTGKSFWYGAIAASIAITTFMAGWQLSVLQAPENPVTGYYLLAERMNAEQQVQLHGMRVGYETAGYSQINGNTEEQLTQLALARQEITESLRETSGDPNLLELLRWVNEQELKLLNQSYTLTQSVQEI
ncbi:hypothetical protein [Idiomarina ramblicola]|uniref:Uncharacterized protein n=1 Tax=Idiomarina ramblicola TaxID=263724 RepID=A0A432YTD8_9GAMM|nr:hypothetical protein [Idiomarina ramblicola]RUO64819.1 hypothetical protein CWI78_11640 [Idiomarina ramblicola]